MCVLGFAGEFKDWNISVNAVWPKTMVATSAIKYHLGGDETIRRSRKDTIVADSIYVLLTAKAGTVTGGFFFDEDILRAQGVTEFGKYKFDKSIKESELIMDGFID